MLEKKQILLLISFFGAICAPCLAQLPMALNEYVSKNYTDIGSHIKRQSTLPLTLYNLKGSVQRLTQDAYDEQGRYINYDIKEGESYTYLFDEDKHITQYWNYAGRDVPVLKEVYYDFKGQRPQYHMRFYAIGKLDYSITYQYNNRGICIGKKTTAGMTLQKESYEIQNARDTMIVSADIGEEFYHKGRLIAKSLREHNQYLEYRYSDHGSLQEWSLYQDGELRQAVELDEEGRIIEQQSFTRRPLDTLVIDSHLVLYDYSEEGQLSSEEHRRSSPDMANFQVRYEYDDNDVVITKTISLAGDQRDLDYLYNEYGDCLNDASGYKSHSLAQIVYSNYDEHDNWLMKSVTDDNGTRKYIRRITYHQQSTPH